MATRSEEINYLVKDLTKLTVTDLPDIEGYLHLVNSTDLYQAHIAVTHVLRLLNEEIKFRASGRPRIVRNKNSA